MKEENHQKVTELDQRVGIAETRMNMFECNMKEELKKE